MLKAFKRKAKQIRYPQGPSRHGNAKIPCYGEGVDVTLVQLPECYIGTIRIFGGKTKRTTQVKGLLCFLLQSRSSIISIRSYYLESNNLYVASIDTELLFPSNDN